MDWQFKVGIGVAILFGLLPFAVRDLPHWITFSGIGAGLLFVGWGLLPNHDKVSVGSALIFIIAISAAIGSGIQILPSLYSHIELAELPLTISELRDPEFTGKSGLVPENLDWDTAALIIRGVDISNFSLTRSVTLRLFLVMKNRKGANWSLEGTGVGRFNRVIGQFKPPPQPGPGQLQEKYILSPVAIAPQQTMSGDLAFVTITTMKFTNDIEREEALALAKGVLGPMVEGGTPDDKFTYTLRITDIITNTTIEIPIPSAGYKGR